jgi:cytochrome c oxidase cbb3-type subunit III
MGIFRVVIAVLVAAGISAALTGWILNERQTAARLAYSYYPAPPTPTTPLGDVAGGAKAPPAAETANPLVGDPNAVAEGHKLFISMNCAGCHGYDAKGGMGPNLTDTFWRYGGTPERIYESIRDGRPKGMPAWGVSLPPQNIWQLVAYIQSLGGTVSASLAQPAAQGDLPDRGQNKGASDLE